jgi:putative hydroxymethylpyrimidine transport system substrate-binding protein
MTPIRRALALLLPALLLLSACGEKEEPAAGAQGGRAEPFRVMLDYIPNADHAGIYAAAESGEYERAGLDVEIQQPPDPSAPLKFLQAGRADLVVSYEPELFLAREKDADLVSVGALVQKPLTSLMAIRKSPVRGVEDLRGRRVGTAGLPYQAAYLRTILRAAGIDPRSVRETSVGFNLVPAMRSGRVDATLPVFFPTDAERPFGWQDPDGWDAYAAWMREQKLITRPEPGSRAMTNEFLPGEGLDPGRQD